ncbi:MAG: bifunctional serine/threonine-protein kinase/formylglycine-generating enzyme family protein [Chthoniobacter sp.]|uniref:bifunctional serine/threonine-protein kinase/formylglycine-generating enzyme family protein n=1 Tax=Chthoniobacter sp. TaxID=2510640 RepID=UPI0032AD9712
MPDTTRKSPPCPQCGELPAGELLALTVIDSKPPGADLRRWVPPTVEELQRGLPQFEILEMAGRGGMGAVYKGRQKSLDRLVAIKVLPADIHQRSGDFAERFKREAKAMARLSHPGIVAVHDAGETAGGMLYFVMDFIAGTDVQRMLAAQGRLAPENALAITAKVCEALAYAHAHGVIHRDIKPSNVMIDTEGQVKVADFGLAKFAWAEPETLTASDVTMGSPDFMAPEAIGAHAHVDHRADLYAVGVMLYQMFTGVVPRGRFDPPSQAVPGLDKRLDRIVDRALQSDRDKRYSTAIEMQTQIARIVPHHRRPGSIIPKGVTPLARKIPFLASLAGLVVAAGVLVYFEPWKHGAAAETRSAAAATRPRSPSLAATPFGSLTGATKDAPWVNTMGQEFVPVPGTNALFCRWPTRVKDYAAYARTTKIDEAWTSQQKDGIPAGRELEHPVVAVTWEEAQAFCQWLTEKETAAGQLPEGAKYRLPTDEEWSHAVGLAAETGATPAEKSGKNVVDYPWGIGFPPARAKVGNYADSAWHEAFPKEPWMENYTDGYPTTSPVDSFPANAVGLCDIGGNVWQWCEDWYDSLQKDRVLRGGSWSVGSRTYLLSSYRMHDLPASRHSYYGFRCVLARARPITSHHTALEIAGSQQR